MSEISGRKEIAFHLRRAAVLSVMLFHVCIFTMLAQTTPQPAATAEQVPVYQLDPVWPKPLPNNWVLGGIVGAAVDSHDHVWIVERPASITPDPNQPLAQSAPPVIEFAADGTLLSSWGGPGPGYDWPREEHGIYVDLHDNVWLAGAGNKDDQILKFTSKGKFLMQIGHPGQSTGSSDTANLGAPASMVVDEAANELYVADGYVNHRVIVFDATTGVFKRQWGAYGNPPDDTYYAKLGIKPGQHFSHYNPGVPGPPTPQFDLVHCVLIAKDGLVYVCDRSNNRLQIFHKDGSFVQEVFLANDILASGTVSDIGFSADPQQRFLFVADSTHQQVFILDRKSLKVLDKFGSPGRLPGQFRVAHNMVVNSKGDIFVADNSGQRIQRFLQTGTRP